MSKNFGVYCYTEAACSLLRAYFSPLYPIFLRLHSVYYHNIHDGIRPLPGRLQAALRDAGVHRALDAEHTRATQQMQMQTQRPHPGFGNVYPVPCSHTTAPPPDTTPCPPSNRSSHTSHTSRTRRPVRGWSRPSFKRIELDGAEVPRPQ
ncbi:hypothetical protein B0H17DRAFT_1337357 [Mycena rosella]|uniref:Uncharacterized protein n=1 Tax=Mycena rosella TaxID=1033263 RepID=A0AAD7CS57_MYCRO|nr:hypothetical protein B0H17DRAFT_1337357 [Mycena rosella]